MHCEVVDQRAQPAALPLGGGELQALIADLGCPQWNLNLVLVDDRAMVELNTRWYGGDGPTDVLSFSYLEATGPDAPDLVAGDGGAAHDLWLAAGDRIAPVTIGEVVIAPAYVAIRCQREKWNLAAEWALLVVHGSLHVLGWVHDTAAQRRAMRVQETALLAATGREHPLSDEEAGD